MFIFPLQRKSSPFRRVKSEEYVVDPRLQDNSFEAKVSTLSDTLFEGLVIQIFMMEYAVFKSINGESYPRLWSYGP